MESLIVLSAPWITNLLFYNSRELGGYLLIQYGFVCGSIIFSTVLFFEGWKKYLMSE